MQLIKIKLRSGSFWGIPPIYLNDDNDTSPRINVDLLTDAQIDVINKSCKAGDIFIKSIDGNNLNEIKRELIIDSSYDIGVDDIIVEDIQLPNIISVTEDTEMEVIRHGEEEIKTEQERQGMLSDSLVLLKKHGNVIKNTINATDKNEYNFRFMQICLSEEENGKMRPGVISAINNWLRKFYESGE